MSQETRKPAPGLSGYFAAADVSREGLLARFSDLFLVAGIVAIVALIALIASGCQLTKVGRKCTGNGWARDTTHVLQCRNGKWAKAMTFGEYLSFLQRLQKPDVRAVDFLSATLPAGSCNFGSWQSSNPIRLNKGSGNSDPYSPASGEFSGVSVNATQVVGYADVDGDGSEEAVLEAVLDEEHREQRAAGEARQCADDDADHGVDRRRRPEHRRHPGPGCLLRQFQRHRQVKTHVRCRRCRKHLRRGC